MAELYEKFRDLMLHDTANKSDTNEEKIVLVYHEILDNWIEDYESYRKNSSRFLDSLETYFNYALGVSASIYVALYDQVINLPVKGTFDQNIVKIIPSDSAIKNVKRIVERSMEDVQIIRISDFSVKTDGFSDFEIREIVSLMIDKFQNDTVENFHWDMKLIDSTVFDFAFLRGLCLRIREPELFYFLTNMFFDRLFTSEYHQDSRNLCEEILISSIKDNFSFYGYFICFRVYSNQGNVQAALMYGNLCLKSVIQLEALPSDKFQFEIIWQSLKMFRNCHLYPLAIRIYDRKPKSIVLSDYDKHALDNSYFNCRLMINEPSLKSALEDYINIERESILKEGTNGCIPWLILLYNLSRIDDSFQYSNSSLFSYIPLFESVVPSGLITKWKNIIFGNSDGLNVQLKESLLKLTKTKNKADFVYDNEMALKIASRIIADSFAKMDFESILIAMIVKSDFSINFVNKSSSEFEQLDLTEYSHESFYEIYNNQLGVLEKLPIMDFDFVIFLINSEEKLFYLIYNKKSVLHYGQFPDWNPDEFRKWKNEELVQFKFDTTIKDKGGQIRNMFAEDYEQESSRFIQNLKFPKLNMLSKVKKVLLIKDMAISDFPHNLLMGSEGLLGLQGSITNILSLEWLNKRIHSEIESRNFDKAIYIPIEGGDLTINMLYEFLLDTIEKYDIRKTTSIVGGSPLDSTINIVSSHGDINISSNEFIYPNDSSVVHNLDGILGSGKILILLVCHSGSATEHFFRNEISTIVKRYLVNGYEAVIAPFWSLHINVPPIWLPVFLEELEKGNEISNAIFHANKIVHEKYLTPAAWACMHLYGNPFFKL
ncbi:hypothetical protein [Algoriphagus algorifonticola]|uniref:hypothetical protein n=1 Tax=Algoriphagus algorifonticola TaxID=2593007 RepID=UPI00119CA12A|nr:hypothetical protein [Algoriphagus algorifonticola]